VRVRSREYVVNEPAADYYGDGLMGAINARAIPREVLTALPGLAAGGAIGSTQSAVTYWWRRLREEQADLRRARRSRNERAINRAERNLERAEDKLNTAQERRDRVREQASSLGTDISRGNLQEQATSGMSGLYGVTDRARDLLSSGDLSSKQTDNLRQAILRTESAMTGLYSKADLVAGRLEKARDRAAELQQISDSVSSGISNGFSLGGIQGAVNPWSGATEAVTGKALLAGVSAYRAKAQKLALSLRKLQEAGYGGTILQEVAAAGVEGGVAMADALLSLSPRETKELQQQYAQIDVWAQRAGQVVTEGYQAGGLAGAEAVVASLEKMAASIDKNIERWGAAIGKSMAVALGIDKRAAGGPTVAGRPYLVGERGPELHTPRYSGQVLTAQQTKYAVAQPTKTVIVTVTNHYPISEPESVATNRALAYAAAVGV
jgi:hypothetical protein